ncbi:MAG TPA: GNAT family protein [Candidatus Baltobacteraceae bacterium]|jgi:RimJ/RimL family protein N-acetyltransferase
MSELRTPRLRLEALTEEHADELFDGLRDERLYEFVPSIAPSDLKGLRSRLRSLESRTSPDGSERWLNWAIRCLDVGRCIGYVQATVPVNAPAKIAYVLFAPFWGLGYGHEAVVGLLDFLSTALQVREIRASVDPDNCRSIALLERLGFRRIAVHRDADTIRGVLRDEIEYALIRL